MQEGEKAQQLEGTRLGDRYRIQRRLGQGAMGAVYAALDEHLERPVAVKVLLEADSKGEVAVARFQREAKAMAAVRHPGIVEVYDRGQSDGQFYVVMERLEGNDLAHAILHDSPLAVDRIVSIAADVADALAEAHRMQVVHRDIKASNIFLSKLGDGQEVVKVLDFGLAKLLRDDQALTRANQVIGTLGYMSPEQVQAKSDITSATDIYALGVVIYEMLTGWLPFMAGNRMQLCYQIVNEPAPEVSDRAPKTPAGLNQLVRRCLQKPPGKRPTASEVAAVLRDEAAVAGQERPEGMVSLPPPVSVGDKD